MLRPCGFPPARSHDRARGFTEIESPKPAIVLRRWLPLEREVHRIQSQRDAADVKRALFGAEECVVRSRMHIAEEPLERVRRWMPRPPLALNSSSTACIAPLAI